MIISKLVTRAVFQYLKKSFCFLFSDFTRSRWVITISFEDSGHCCFQSISLFSQMLSSELFISNFLRFPVRSAYIFVCIQTSGTRGGIIFIHPLCSTVSYSLTLSVRLPRCSHVIYFITSQILWLDAQIYYLGFTDFAQFSCLKTSGRLYQLLYEYCRFHYQTTRRSVAERRLCLLGTSRNRSCFLEVRRFQARDSCWPLLLRVYL